MFSLIDHEHFVPALGWLGSVNSALLLRFRPSVSQGDRTIEHRPVLSAGPTKCLGPKLKFKRQAAGVTAGAGDKRNILPAIAAQATGFSHQSLAA